jgi:hypothetical protein
MMVGHPETFDRFAGLLKNFGIDAAMVLFQSSMSGKITTLVPNGTIDIIKQRRDLTYHQEGRVGTASGVRIKEICDLAKNLSERREFEEALKVLETGLDIVGAPKKKRNQLDRAILTVKTAIETQKNKKKADAILKKKEAEKLMPKQPPFEKPVVNPETQIEGMVFDPGEPPEPTIGDVVVNENANNTNPTDELKLF